MIKATKTGVTTEMTISVKAERAKFTKSILKVLASTSSSRYTSLENRFRILPAGVVSKKDIGALKMAVAIRSCSFRDASIEQKIHRIRVWITVNAADPTPKAK
jgi:hypothetical protein